MGASGALFGILGGEVAWLLLNWHLMHSVARNQELCSVITVLIINFLLGGVNPLIDNYAHLGGMFAIVHAMFACQKLCTFSY